MSNFQEDKFYSKNSNFGSTAAMDIQRKSFVDEVTSPWNEEHGLSSASYKKSSVDDSPLKEENSTVYNYPITADENSFVIPHKKKNSEDEEKVETKSLEDVEKNDVYEPTFLSDVDEGAKNYNSVDPQLYGIKKLQLADNKNQSSKVLTEKHNTKTTKALSSNEIQGRSWGQDFKMAVKDIPYIFTKNDFKSGKSTENQVFKDIESRGAAKIKKKRTSRRRRFFLVLASFVLFFCTLLFFTKAQFNSSTLLSEITLLMQNSITAFEKLPAVRSFGKLIGVKEEANDIADYKLTIVSKSLDNYFKNLLIETQGVLSKEEVATALINNTTKSYFSANKARGILADYLKKNKDVLGFSLYGLNIDPIISVKYQKIPNYEINESLKKMLRDKNNLLLKHQGSENLVLFSKVFYEGKIWLYVVQTLHPSFFARILAHLEVNDELFYIRDNQNFVMLDNFDAVRFGETKSAEVQESGVFSIYQGLIKKEEQAISLHLDEVSYKLGMVVVKNSLWGQMVVLSILAGLFAFCFFLVLQISVLVRKN